MQTGIRRIAGLLLAVVVTVLALSGTAQAAAAVRGGEDRYEG